MSKGYKARGSIFRRGAGRSFLQFLIGEVLLIVLCSVVYLFVLQGTINITLPTDTQVPTASPESFVTQAPTIVPTIEPTAAPTDAPTPDPTASPIPPENLVVAASELTTEFPLLNSAELKLGLKEFKLFTDAGQQALIVRGYAYIEGADAAQSTGYIVLMDSATGEVKGLYAVTPNSEDAFLSFDEASGTNLDQAFFQLNLDTAAIESGVYLMSMAVANGDKFMWNYFDSSLFHFSIFDGVVTLSE